MWHDFELNGEFLCLLLEIDRQIAETVREAGCRCGGQLDGGTIRANPGGLRRRPRRRLAGGLALAATKMDAVSGTLRCRYGF
jgi:hypothetical protein